ncbi:MAG: hypothetical protein A2073_07290 [Deltaproteobacteria bacterium GWC2_42_11]|nr:MAG: hypothetical protein A2073_07290 [Deltaproteobacteria bacterium GWC2_42_11]HBO85151.1 hypothetical protein [Deltaproteobacteria bacterium]
MTTKTADKSATTIKQRIKQQFSSSAQNYDSKAGFQKKIAEELLEYLVPQLATCNLQLATILDIGCGTGFLSIPLAQTFSDAHISACDMAHAMAKTAKIKYSSLITHHPSLFLTADCEYLPYKDSTFDMLASSLTFQWLLHHGTVFSEAHRVLKKGGIFSFSMLGQNTLRELRMCYKEANAVSNKDGIPRFMSFPHKDEVCEQLEKTGFSGISAVVSPEVEEYPDMMGLLRVLKTIGAGNPFDSRVKNLSKGLILKKMSEIYGERFEAANGVYATYEVIFFTCKKP